MNNRTNMRFSKSSILRVPQENRTAVVEPSFDQVPSLVEQNRGIRDQFQVDLQGRSLAEISILARAELLAMARRWTAAYRNVPTAPPDPNGLVYLAGHQPQMFHPGVWFKNFALGALAKRHSATAVNLIVDNDVVSDASLPIPGGSVSEPRSMRIPFDLPDPKIPFEERRIEDRELFASFGRRVIEQIAPLVADPLIAEYWPLAQKRAQHGENLGACLAQARHQLEGKFLAGAATLEVPQSWICTGEAFQWFVVHILGNLKQFIEVHNQAVREYRKEHHVRSRSHPVPELAEDGLWLEAPLWIWTAEDPRRRRLFARRAAGEIVLSDRGSWEARLPFQNEADAGRAVERLLELQKGQTRIRSRALMTTLWARLALGDLFIHGIGGAKYDQVTDRLIERFFGIRPPGFLVISATLRLPVESDRVSMDDIQRWCGSCTAAPAKRDGNTTAIPTRTVPVSEALDEARAIQHGLRSMTYHPEKFLDGLETNDSVAKLVAEEARLGSRRHRRGRTPGNDAKLFRKSTPPCSHLLPIVEAG